MHGVATVRGRAQVAFAGTAKLVTTALDSQLVLERLLIGMLGAKTKKRAA